MKQLILLMKPFLILIYISLFTQADELDKSLLTQANTNNSGIDEQAAQEPDYCMVKGSGDYQAVRIELEGSALKLYEYQSKKNRDYQLIEDVIQIKRKGSFEIFITHSNGYSRSLVWIDWNGDGDFTDPKEFQKPLGKGSFFSGEGEPTYGIEVNISKRLVESGIIRMRVITGDSWSLDDDKIPTRPCDQLFNATVKDFRLLVL